MYHISNVKRATYEVVSDTTDAETDRKGTVRECECKCHEAEEPLSFNMADEEEGEEDEAPELIETEDEDKGDKPEPRQK